MKDSLKNFSMGRMTAILLTSLLGGVAANAESPSCEKVRDQQRPPTCTETYALHSGIHDNAGDKPRVVFETVIGGADWPGRTSAIRLDIRYADANVPPGSSVNLVSLHDGATRTLPSSAFAPAYLHPELGYFFPHTVLHAPVRVELVAGPRTADNFFRIEHALVLGRDDSDKNLGDWIQEKTICGQDNRVPTTNAAVARLLESDGGGGCTGFLVDCPDDDDAKCMLSAGHCFVSGTGNHQVSEIAQFDVPPSDRNCDINPPTNPNKIFRVDMSTVRRGITAVNGGRGNDWAVVRLLRNPTTGRTAFEEQGAALPLANASPASGTVEVPGYGVDAGTASDPCSFANCGTTGGQRNQVLQTHSGNLAPSSGNRISYSVDTCGGNSGAPVISVATGQVIGIHTHGGCRSSGGTNSGTAITHPDLQAALAACKKRYGVVLIDRTGSMGVRRATGRTRCADALTTARNDIEEFFHEGNDERRLAVWTFQSSAATNRTGGFVRKQAALDAVDALSPTGCTGLTPLAEAMCEAADALAEVRSVDRLAKRFLAVSSDGGENNSSGECAGFGSFSSRPPYDSGSWQRKVRDKLRGNNVVLSRFWTSVSRSTTDLELELEGLEVSEAGLSTKAVSDLDFFSELASTTGGRTTQVDDSEDQLPPPFFSEIFVDGFDFGDLGAWSRHVP